MLLCCRELQLWCTDQTVRLSESITIRWIVGSVLIVMELPVPEEDRDPVGS